MSQHRWHSCKRWHEQRMSCPFGGDPSHEPDDPDRSRDLDPPDHEAIRRIVDRTPHDVVIGKRPAKDALLPAIGKPVPEQIPFPLPRETEQPLPRAASVRTPQGVTVPWSFDRQVQLHSPTAPMEGLPTTSLKPATNTAKSPVRSTSTAKSTATSRSPVRQPQTSKPGLSGKAEKRLLGDARLAAILETQLTRELGRSGRSSKQGTSSTRTSANTEQSSGIHRTRTSRRGGLSGKQKGGLAVAGTAAAAGIAMGLFGTGGGRGGFTSMAEVFRPNRPLRFAN